MNHYPAARLPSHIGLAPWREILPVAPVSFPQLDQSTRADVTIIGAGFAGLAASQRLVQLDPSLRVAVLDAGKIAEGASGRNSGFMIDLPHNLASENYSGDAFSADQKLIELNRQAIAFAKNSVEQYNINRDYFSEVGKVNGAASSHADKCNTDYSNHLDTLNEPYQRLDARAMYELTGSRHYLSGIYTPGTVLIQPAGYSLSLASGLNAHVDIYENSPALVIKRDATSWVVESSNGSVTSNQVIIAANGHLESFGFAKKRLMHIFLYASMTREFNAEDAKHIGGQDNWGITPSDPMGTTMRRLKTPSGGSRIITRTCAHYLPEMRTSRDKMNKAAIVHLQKFRQRFAHLSEAQMQYQWAGHLCLTHNGVSVAQELEQGLYSACVQNGLGLTRGILTGISAAERCLGLKTEIGAFFESEKQASLLPPALFAKPVANALLKWKERRAANE
ncbi:MAG: FAD-binding oxidoreductase [Granulosicoccaceae bacterium]